MPGGEGGLSKAVGVSVGGGNGRGSVLAGDVDPHSRLVAHLLERRALGTDDTGYSRSRGVQNDGDLHTKHTHELKRLVSLK